MALSCCQCIPASWTMISASFVAMRCFKAGVELLISRSKVGNLVSFTTLFSSDLVKQMM